MAEDGSADLARAPSLVREKQFKLINRGIDSRGGNFGQLSSGLKQQSYSAKLSYPDETSPLDGSHVAPAGSAFTLSPAGTFKAFKLASPNSNSKLTHAGSLIGFAREATE